MLSEYNSYLLGLRNNLIRCGVEVSNKELSRYFDTFQLECELSEVLWLYSVLSIGGSKNMLKDFMLPLNGYYKSKIRELFYQEYLQTSTIYAKISVNSKLGGITDNKYMSPSEEEDNIEVDEVVDLFEDEENYVGTGTYIEDLFEESSRGDAIEESNVSSGTYIENLEEFNNEQSDKMYLCHGVYIEDLEDSDVKEIQNERYSNHGVYVEDIEINSGVDAAEVDEENSRGYSEGGGEDIEEYEEDSWGYEDEDGLKESEEYEEEPWGYEDEEEDSEEYEEEPWGYSDEDELEDSEDYEEDTWNFADEDELEDSEEYEEEPWGYEDEDVEEYNESSEYEEEPWGYSDEENESVSEDDIPDWSDEEQTPTKSEDSIKLEKISEDAEKIRDLTSRFVSTGLSGLSKGINKLRNSSK